MHEMSVALEVCRVVERQVGPGALADVVEVGLDVGDDAGVEIGNLEFCLGVLLSSPPFRDGRPAIRRRPGTVLDVTYLEVDDDHSNH